MLEKIGTKIYNAAIKKRNEYVADRNQRKAIDAEAKEEAKKEYWEQYSASRKAELIDRATDKAYARAHRPSGMARFTSGAQSAGKVGKSILGAMPTLANKQDPFHLGNMGNAPRHKNRKRKKQRPNNYFDNLP